MNTPAHQHAAQGTPVHVSLWLRAATAGLLICGLGACDRQMSSAPPPSRAAAAGSAEEASMEAPRQVLPPPAMQTGETAAIEHGHTGPTGDSAPPPQPHYQVSGPQQPLHGPENKDITLLLSLDLPQAQLQAYYDSRFKDAETPAVEREGTMQGYQARYSHLRASIDCGDGRVITCTPMAGYPTDVDTEPGVMVWRWNVVGVDDGKSTAARPQDVRIVVLGASEAAGPYERIDSIPDIPLQVKVDALTTAERLIAAWTHLADSIKALLVAVIAAIGVLTAWLRSVFKKAPAKG